MTAEPSPGIAPSVAPSQLHRSTSHQRCSTSRTPSSWPRRVSIDASAAMLRRAAAMSMSSGIANRPSVNGTSGTPSQRYNVSNVQRSVPDCGSLPIIAASKPKPAAVMPLSGAWPLNVATVDSANTQIAKRSGDCRLQDHRAQIGMLTASKNAPAMPPSSDAVYAAPNARPACPCCASG